MSTKDTKKCTKCGLVKCVSEFSIRTLKSGKISAQPKCKACNKLYREEHIDYNKTWKAEYYKENKKTITIYSKFWISNKRATDLTFKIMDCMRSRIMNAIKKQSGTKAYRTIELLGCSIEHARKHLESLFQEGMTWENHGVMGWHIDHIRPCASFDLSDPEQQKQCFNYTNLQPLWAEDNLRKSDKW